MTASLAYELGSSLPPRGSVGAQRWPGARLSSVPDPSGMRAVIGQVCEWWGASEPCALDPQRVFDTMGWAVVEETLGAAQGLHRAMLIPRLCGGFTVVVDPALTPEEAANGCTLGEIRRFRLAHELAHSFFYSDGVPPRRLLRLSIEEEAACDSFAAAVCGAEEPTIDRRGERVLFF